MISWNAIRDMCDVTTFCAVNVFIYDRSKHYINLSMLTFVMRRRRSRNAPLAAEWACRTDRRRRVVWVPTPNSRTRRGRRTAVGAKRWSSSDGQAVVNFAKKRYSEPIRAPSIRMHNACNRPMWLLAYNTRTQWSVVVNRWSNDGPVVAY